MIVSEIQVSEAIGMQTVEPLRLSTEDKTLEGRSLNGGSMSFQIAHHHICRAQKNSGFIGNNASHTSMFQIVAYASIKQDIAREEDGEGVARKPPPYPSLKGRRICGKGRCYYGYLKHCD